MRVCAPHHDPEVNRHRLWHSLPSHPSGTATYVREDTGCPPRGDREYHGPVRDHQDHSIDAAVEAGPGAKRTDPKDPGSRRV